MSGNNLNSKSSILIQYETLEAEQLERINAIRKQLNKISFARLGLFIAEILVVALMINIGYSPVFIVLLIIPVVGFLYLVKQQASVSKMLQFSRKLHWVFKNEIDHLTTKKNGYSNGSVYADESHHYTADLDIFGNGSLYEYVNRCTTAKGLDMLAQNLSIANDRVIIKQRQEAVMEVFSHISDTFNFRAELLHHDAEHLKQIEIKLSKQLPLQLTFTHNILLRSYAMVAPFLSILVLIAASAFGGHLWTAVKLIAAVNFVVSLAYLKKVNILHASFSGSSGLLSSFSRAIRWTETIDWKSSYIKLFFSHTSERNASSDIGKLASVIQAFDARLNLIVGGLFNLFFLWDIRCSIRLDDWHKESSELVMNALETVSRIEELISLATISHNHPDWIFPEIAPAFSCIATNVGHPLIADDLRVNNHYNLHKTATVDIITGSNMAGKSTFLRTLGINMVLAYSGAPVCAETMSLSVFNVLSYMRIRDSLNDQTSTFKAELNRLKMILDEVVQSDNSFVLIDEMLRGTNSRDKYLGSKVFIEKLISTHTQALFATHDLQLSEMTGSYPDLIRNFHFDIQITSGEMKFDYKLKNGPCQTFNAAVLLKEIGLALN